MYSLSENVPTSKEVQKLLSVLPEAWASKIEAICEAPDLGTLTMDELIGDMKTYELKKT